MNLTPAALVAHAKSEPGRRAIRYSATSLICVAITQVLLFTFTSKSLLGWRPGWGNITAVMLTSIPAFILNKRWVWGKRGKAHMRREVIPFGVFTLAGWVLSTLMVVLATDATSSMSRSAHQLAIQAANIAGFGILWVLKYLFLDKIMFGEHHHTPYDADIERVEVLAHSGEVPSVGAQVAPPSGRP